MSRSLASGLFVLAMVGVGAASVYYSRRRVREWCAAQGFTLLTQRYCWMPIDAPDIPWEWLGGRRPGAGVIYITVKDREQTVRCAWLKVGGLIAYALDLEPEVVWDQRPTLLHR